MSAPLLGDDAVLGELLAHAGGVGSGLVDLVHGHDDGHACGLGVVDGLDSLRHDAVVGSHDKNDDVGHLGTTGTHGREGLVTGGVDEGDGATVNLDLRGTDGLRDAAGLALGDAGVADGVKQRRLAVVDVAHDGDHGRTGLQILGVVVEGKGVLLLLGHDLDVATQVVGDQLDKVIGHGLGEREGVAQEEEALDDVVGRHAEKLGELRDRGALRDLHGVELREVLVVGDGLLYALLLRGLLGLLLAALLAAAAPAGGLARRLLDGLAGLVEDAATVVGLGLAGHAAVAVLALVAATAALAALAARTALALLGTAVLLHAGRGGVALALGARVLGLATALATALALGLLLRSLLGLLLEHLLLLGNLVEQRGEGGHRLGGVVVDAVALGLLGAFLCGLLGGAFLLLLGALPRGLGGSALLLLLGALALAALLGSNALLLGGLLLGLLGLGGGLLLGLLGGLDLGGAVLEDGLELLAHDGDVGILERRGGGLGGNLHVAEMVEHLLARHPVLLGKVVYASLGHVTNLSFTGGRAARVVPAIKSPLGDARSESRGHRRPRHP